MKISMYLPLNILFSLALFFVLTPTTNGQNSTGNTIEKPGMVEDLTLLQQALEEIHPGLYRYNTPSQINELFTSLKEQLPDSLSEAEATLRIAQLIAKVRCGHTYLNPWNMESKLRERLLGGERYLPLGFQVIDGRFFTTFNASGVEELQRGAELLSINGYATKTIYDSLKTIAKSDGNNFASYDYYLSLDDFKSRDWEAFDVYFPLFFPLKENKVEVSYRNYETTEIAAASLPLMTKSGREQRMLEEHGQKVLDKKEWSIELDEKEDLAIMKLGTFAIWNWKNFDQKRWFKEAFALLEEKNIGNLVIDIRGNGGGLSEPRDELLSYLTDEKMECEENGKILIRTTKVSTNLLPYCDTWVEAIKTGLPKSRYSPYSDLHYELNEKEDCVTIKSKKKNRYKGNSYVMSNGSNTSATYTLINRIKKNGLATVVGGTTGGNLQGINGGQYIFFRMPNSKIEVDLPLKFYAPLNPEKDEGVEPDVAVTQSQAAIAKEQDAYLLDIKAIITEGDK